MTDAKDNLDKCNSDTPTYGSQKSLAFTIAWLGSVLRGDNTKMAWTSTQNMFADGGTKLMKLDHVSRMLQSNEWSVTLHGHLLNLGNQLGWHKRGNYLVHVAKNAKAFRTPEPRAEASKFPMRSTYAMFVDSNESCEWRNLELKKLYVGLPNRHETFGDVAATLVTVFMPWVPKQEESLSAEESCALHRNP